MTRASASAAEPASAAITPSTSLSAIDAVTSVIGPAAQVRPQIVERDGERRGAGRVVGAVEEHVAAVDREQLEPTRPASRRRSPRGARRRGCPRCPPPPVRRGGRRATRDVLRPGGGPAVRRASGRGAAARPRSRRATCRGPGPARRPSSGTPRRPARRRTIASASPRCAGHGDVAAFDDRRLLAGDVGDRRARAGPCGRDRRS